MEALTDRQQPRSAGIGATNHQAGSRHGDSRMATTREQLHAMIDTLPDDQVEFVLTVAETLHKWRSAVSTCEPAEALAPPALGGTHEQVYLISHGIALHESRS